MKQSTKVQLILCLVAAVVGALFVWLHASSYWSEDMTNVEIYHVLCDSFTIPGLMMILMGMLMSLSYVGALDTLAYLLSYIPKMLVPGAFGEVGSLLEFVEERREKRKKGYGFLYIVGFIYFGIALIFLALYYNA